MRFIMLFGIKTLSETIGSESFFCKNCLSFQEGMRITSRPFFHLFSFPIFPLDKRLEQIRCKNCNSNFGLDLRLPPFLKIILESRFELPREMDGIQLGETLDFLKDHSDWMVLDETLGENDISFGPDRTMKEIGFLVDSTFVSAENFKVYALMQYMPSFYLAWLINVISATHGEPSVATNEVAIYEDDVKLSEVIEMNERGHTLEKRKIYSWQDNHTLLGIICLDEHSKVFIRNKNEIVNN